MTDFVLESAEVANDPVYGRINDSGRSNHIEEQRHFVFAHQSYSDGLELSFYSSDTQAFPAGKVFWTYGSVRTMYIHSCTYNVRT